MSDRTLVVKPSGLPEAKNKPWVLVFRSHDLSGTDYEPLVYLTDDAACEVVEISNGGISWLYGIPDWAARDRARALEKARVLREQAAEIEAANAH